MMEKDTKNMPTVYSFHTFYFPFVWSDKGSFQMDEFIKALKNDLRWSDISVKEFSEADDTKVANYQSLQYFTGVARKSLFGWDEDFVKCFDYEGVKGVGRYCIKKDGVTYSLVLDGIKLKVYNTGIAVLTIEAENHDYRTMKAVKDINEYGRRIFAPYFNNDGKCDACADLLEIRLGATAVSSAVSTVKFQNLDQCIPSFIRHFLPDIKINPAVDDRMFVACLVNDAEEFKLHKNYKTDEAASKSLYELIYIDRQGGCTCPTESMRMELLERSIYRRWIELKFGEEDSGTIYAISHHSMVCLTCATDAVYVEIPFLTQYTHIISIALAQRATILAFDEEVSVLSRDFEKKGTRFNSKRIKKLKKLQEKHIAFLNQHINIEITNQEQGIELYQMLQKEMYIKDELEILLKDIELLANAANTANDVKLNVLALVFTIIFGIVSVISIIPILISFFQFLKLL